MFGRRGRSILFLMLIAVSSGQAAVRVAFLPFEDKVKLKDTWNLAVDVPRWFSQTVDTVGRADSAVVCIPFDSTLSVTKQLKWKKDDVGNPSSVSRLGSVLKAQYVVTGTVKRFRVAKQALNTGAPIGSSHKIGEISGQGGISIEGGLQSYEADLFLEIQIYDVVTGTLIRSIDLDSKEKDSGFKLWLPFQFDNPEMNFYYMSRSPFGSLHFRNGVVGALMMSFSNKIKDGLLTPAGSIPAIQQQAVHMIEGKVLDREGKDVYIDLGSADRIRQGELFEVLRPDRALVSSGGDTLGMVDKAVGTVRISFVKAVRFSVARIESESDSIRAGWTVRTMSPASKQ